MPVINRLISQLPNDHPETFALIPGILLKASASESVAATINIFIDIILNKTCYKPLQLASTGFNQLQTLKFNSINILHLRFKKLNFIG
jgi:hypothetical protein